MTTLLFVVTDKMAINFRNSFLPPARKANKRKTEYRVQPCDKQSSYKVWKSFEASK